LSRTIKKNSRLNRLNGFSSRNECEQNAKIVCFFVTQNSFLLVPLIEQDSPTVRLDTNTAGALQLEAPPQET
jgi:hypothetical protein